MTVAMLDEELAPSYVTGTRLKEVHEIRRERIDEANQQRSLRRSRILQEDMVRARAPYLTYSLLTADRFPNRDVRRGVVLRIERRGPELLARRISGWRSFHVRFVMDSSEPSTPVSTIFAHSLRDRPIED